jgi:hypothetical protein
MRSGCKKCARRSFLVAVSRCIVAQREDGDG